MLTGLKRLILWDYERGVWQYDVVCGVIVLFIAFSRNIVRSIVVTGIK